MLGNCSEFHLLDSAAMHLGAAPFSIYFSNPPAQIEPMIRNSEARGVFAQPQHVEKTLEVQRRTGLIEHMVVLGDDAGAEQLAIVGEPHVALRGHEVPLEDAHVGGVRDGVEIDEPEERQGGADQRVPQPGVSPGPPRSHYLSCLPMISFAFCSAVAMISADVLVPSTAASRFGWMTSRWMSKSAGENGKRCAVLSWSSATL